jgi:hypothetical protein
MGDPVKFELETLGLDEAGERNSILLTNSLRNKRICEKA